MVSQGAELAVDKGRWSDFESLGHKPEINFSAALEAADVVIDCTPAGNSNKEKFYDQLANDPLSNKFFIAQGSEKGFGIPYAYGINDEILPLSKRSRFVQVVSCNTHAIGRIIKTLSGADHDNFSSGDFVCIRRSNDTSQDSGFVPSPSCGSHTDPIFGTHHARDVSDLFQTLSRKPLSLTSSALKVNSQYMHAIRFSVSLDEEVSLGEVLNRFKEDKFATLTHHTTANKVFSFGRDHGFYGIIYNQAVVCLPSVSVFPGPQSSSPGTIIKGFAFTPQDGNSILSSVAATLYGLHGSKYTNYLNSLLGFLLDEV